MTEQEIDKMLSDYETKKILEQDYISRDDVITIIARKYLFKDQKDFSKCVRMTAKQIKELPVYHMNEDRWIPVSQSLPEDCVDVLIYIERDAFDENGCHRGRYIDIGFQSNGNWFCSRCRNLEVFAWQPFPEPPKEI